MKFKIFIITILLLATACTSKEKDIQIITSEKSEDIYKEDVPKYVDDNPITVGIYENGINLIKDFKMIKQSRNEVIFCLFYTNEEELGHNSQKENWYNFYSKYTNIDDYKIGFHFSFYVGDTLIEKTVLNTYTFTFEPTPVISSSFFALKPSFLTLSIAIPNPSKSFVTASLTP